MENLTKHDAIVCEFALSTFNSLDPVVNSPCCSYKFNVVYVQREKSEYFFTAATYELYTFKSKSKLKS